MMKYKEGEDMSLEIYDPFHNLLCRRFKQFAADRSLSIQVRYIGGEYINLPRQHERAFHNMDRCVPQFEREYFRYEVLSPS